MSDQAQASPGGFSFLFRRDEGTISRGTWWRGTLGLLGVLAALSAIWKLLSGFTKKNLHFLAEIWGEMRNAIFFNKKC